MSQESRYLPKEDTIVLHSLAESDLRLLEQHGNIKRISIWLEGLATPNLDFLLNCKNIEMIDIYGGKVGDYSALSKLPKLKTLFLNGRGRRWLEDLDFLSQLYALESILIIYYPMISRFPNVQNLLNLRSVTIMCCKRLIDISNITLIPNLECFGISTSLLNADDLECIAQKSGMKKMHGQLGSKRKNDAFESMLEKYGVEASWF